MTLEIAIPHELEDRLRREAERQGVSPATVTLKMLDEHLPSANRQAAIAMLQKWVTEDEMLTDEQLAANAAVLRAFDADRLSDRKLFADVLKDKAS